MHSSLLPRTVSWHVLLGGDLTMLVKRSPYLAFPLTWPKQSDNRQEALTLEVFQPKKSETQTNFHDWIHFCFDQHLSFGSAAWRCLLATAVSPAGNNFSPSLSVCSCDATPLCVQVWAGSGCNLLWWHPGCWGGCGHYPLGKPPSPRSLCHPGGPKEHVNNEEKLKICTYIVYLRSPTA